MLIQLLEISGGSAFLYILVIICLRMLGKKGIAELSIGDLVLIILIGEALGSLIPQENAFISAVACILTLSLMNFILGRASFRSKTIKKFLEGSPVILIKDGKLLKEKLKKEKLTLDEMMEAIRTNGIMDITQVDHAVLETDGKISIIKKS